MDTFYILTLCSDTITTTSALVTPLPSNFLLLLLNFLSIRTVMTFADLTHRIMSLTVPNLNS